VALAIVDEVRSGALASPTFTNTIGTTRVTSNKGDTRAAGCENDVGRECDEFGCKK
jgi:hypothetical protein